MITGLSIKFNWVGYYITQAIITNPISNLEKIIFAFGYMNSGNRFVFLTAVYTYSNNLITLGSIEDYTLDTLVIQYTKTTD